jgi:ketosteroid isomerase-like protein
MGSGTFRPPTRSAGLDQVHLLGGLTTLDVKPLGPSAASEIGTFSLRTKGPTPQEVTGKYMVVWEKVGGDWKLAADIWNYGK